MTGMAMAAVCLLCPGADAADRCVTPQSNGPNRDAMDRVFVDGGVPPATSFVHRSGREDARVIGIFLGGGDRRTLVPGSNVASNFRICRTQNGERDIYGAITSAGAGSRAERFDICDLLEVAISNVRNDNLLHSSGIRHCLKTGSENPFSSTVRNPSAMTLQVGSNFMHHNGNPRDVCAIVHMDGSHHCLIFRNRDCYRNARKAFFNKGYPRALGDSVFIGNFVRDMRPAGSEHGIRGGRSSGTRMAEMKAEPYGARLFDAVDVRQPACSTRYPRLTEPARPSCGVKGSSLIKDNACINSGVLDLHRPNNPAGVIRTSNGAHEDSDLGSLDSGSRNSREMDSRMSSESDIFKKVPDFRKLGCAETGPSVEA